MKGEKRSMIECSNDAEIAGCAFWDAAFCFQEGA